jgi:hypothetical protein
MMAHDVPAFHVHGRGLRLIRRPQNVVFIGLVDEPAADDRDDAAADQNVRFAIGERPVQHRGRNDRGERGAAYCRQAPGAGARDTRPRAVPFSIPIVQAEISRRHPGAHAGADHPERVACRRAFGLSRCGAESECHHDRGEYAFPKHIKPLLHHRSSSRRAPAKYIPARAASPPQIAFEAAPMPTSLSGLFPAADRARAQPGQLPGLSGLIYRKES